MKTVYVIGSINTDLVIGAPYMPASGETLTGSGFFTAHGGKGANQAVAAARLGGKVVMCACVGDDDFGKLAIQALQKDGIDTRFVRIVENTPTGTAVIVVVDGDNRIILDKGANACLSEQDVEKALAEAEEGDILLTQLENPVDIVGFALKKGKEKGMKVILNPAPADVHAEKYLNACDLVIPNETETEIFGGRENILKKTGGNLIVTLGSKGFEIIQNYTANSYPCIKVKAVDTTAAGDTFCGGLVAKLADGESLEEAAKFGSLAASIACTRKGAQPSVPTKEEVETYKA
ncbi:MAG: ribokinase [Clostridia bacterium]|nr:ribokinase [Clostridia bacterium]